MSSGGRAATARDWSSRLGMAFTELLPEGRTDPGRHYAMMDGVDGSFVLSTEDVDEGRALDWAWSSRFPAHVAIGADAVLARQVHPAAPVLKFRVQQVEDDVERFFGELNSRLLDPPASVEDHVVQCFRSHRHVAAQHNLTDEQSLDAFLGVLDGIVAGRSLAADPRLPQPHQEQLREALGYNSLVRRRTDLALTMRHAAGMVFQETHAELSTVPVQQDLFGLPFAPGLSTRNRSGAYYTPPGLARALTDIALTRYLGCDVIRIVDPACGSGVFLGEAARSLQRLGFAGRVELLGLDVSRAAVKMAQFALKHNDAVRQEDVELRVGDFLACAESLDADVIVMNPPFVAAPELAPALRETAKQILGKAYVNRPDLSMVFTAFALRHLKPGGTLTTLLPAGVLAQEGGRRWRSSIAEARGVDLVAVLGDHGLFRDAVVSVAALVLHNDSEPFGGSPVEVWASGRRGASSAALRRLRRWVNGNRRPERTEDWSIRQQGAGYLLERDDWTPRPALLGDLPRRLRQTPHVVCVNDQFRVELGVRAGKLKQSLQLSGAQYSDLPQKERKFFRPVAETRSISSGAVEPRSWVFYPDLPMTYGEISRGVPRYFEKFIQELGFAEDAVVDFYRACRKTNVRGQPRVVSRAFIGTGSFAADLRGEYVVTQGHAWRPVSALLEGPFDVADLLSDYAFILNSWPFFLLAREHGRIVAGGQVEGARKYVGSIPLPCLPTLYMEFPEVREEAEHLRRVAVRTYPGFSELNAFAASAYLTQLDDWPVPR